MKTALILALFFVSFIPQAHADPQRTLDYAQAIIEARISYNQKLVEYFSDSKITVAEKKAHFKDLAGHELFRSIPQLVSDIEEYVEYYQNFLNIIQNKNVDLTLVPETETKLQEMIGTPDPEDVLRYKIRKLYLQADLRKHAEQDIRRTKSLKKFLDLQDITGYSEFPFFRRILSLLKREISPNFMEYLSKFNFLVDSKNVSVIDGVYPNRYKLFRNRITEKLNHYLDEVLPQLIQQERISIIKEYEIRSALNWSMKFIIFNRSLKEKIKKTKQLISIVRSSEVLNKLTKVLDRLNEIRCVDLPLIYFEALVKTELDLNELEENYEKVMAKPLPPQSPITPSAPLPVSKTEFSESIFTQPKIPAVASPSEEIVASSSSEEVLSPIPPAAATPQLNIKGRRQAEKEAALALKGDTSESEEMIFFKGKSLNRSDFQAFARDRLSGRFRESFLGMFDDSQNHNKFRFEELVTLVERVDGKVTQNGTSHVQIVIPGGIGQSWKPHGTSDSKVPRVCVKQFRAAFEMAGITPALFD